MLSESCISVQYLMKLAALTASRSKLLPVIYSRSIVFYPSVNLNGGWIQWDSKGSKSIKIRRFRLFFDFLTSVFGPKSNSKVLH